MKLWTTYHTKDITAKYMYRFLTLDFLRDFLKTGNIYFARADRFLDNMECAHVDDLSLPNRLEIIEARKKMHLVSCWNLGNTDSFAMWNQNHASGSDRRVVALRFSAKYLMQSFKISTVPIMNFYYRTEFYMGKVSYFPLADATQESLQNHRILYPIFRKDHAFAFENEFRFVIKYHADSKEAPQGFSFWLNYPYALEFDILVNPSIAKCEFDQIVSVAEEFRLGERVKPSRLKSWVKEK